MKIIQGVRPRKFKKYTHWWRDVTCLDLEIIEGDSFDTASTEYSFGGLQRRFKVKVSGRMFVVSMDDYSLRGTSSMGIRQLIWKRILKDKINEL